MCDEFCVFLSVVIAFAFVIAFVVACVIACVIACVFASSFCLPCKVRRLIPSLCFVPGCIADQHLFRWYVWWGELPLPFVRACVTSARYSLRYPPFPSHPPPFTPSPPGFLFVSRTTSLRPLHAGGVGGHHGDRMRDRAVPAGRVALWRRLDLYRTFWGRGPGSRWLARCGIVMRRLGFGSLIGLVGLAWVLTALMCATF